MSDNKSEVKIVRCGLCGKDIRELRWAAKLNDKAVHNECARVTLDQHWTTWEWNYFGVSPERFKERFVAWKQKAALYDKLHSQHEERQANREYRRSELVQFVNRLANVDKWLATFRAYRRGDSACAARALDDLEEAIQALLDSDRGRNLLDRRIVEKAKVAQ